MNILIIHAHWNNRGDEAALRAMIDALVQKYPDAKINVMLETSEVKQAFRMKNVSLEPMQYPRKRDLLLESVPLLLSRGKWCFTSRSRHFTEMVRRADVVVHAPGGPSIGDIYVKQEMHYLYRLLIVKAMKKPYMFYAPSMGPFRSKKPLRNLLRKKVLSGASVFCLREPVSQKYVREFSRKLAPTVTLDAAFQYPVDEAVNRDILERYESLNQFLTAHEKVIGMTITDLAWNPRFSKDKGVADRIRASFSEIMAYLSRKGYGVLFIPQLFGSQNDKDYMTTFCTDNCFVMEDTYDCYFQQYVIAKLYALIGMRYHSNIFSAKMGSPFISVAYEQKMLGFMKKADLSDYCIPIEALSFETLRTKFERLESHYDDYRERLSEMRPVFAAESAKTTEALLEFMKNHGIG